MRKIVFIVFFAVLYTSLNAQTTCTIKVSGGWSTRVCDETLSAPAAGNKIVIDPGVVVTSNSNNQVLHTGNFELKGRLEIDHQNVVVNGSITIMNGGNLQVDEKLNLGAAGACGTPEYALYLNSGAKITVNSGSSSDKIFICGVEVIRGGSGGGTCTDDPAYPLCAGNWGGDVECGENGISCPSSISKTAVTTLPVILHYFSADQNANGTVELSWATTTEENFQKFIVQRSNDGKNFSDIGEVAGQGRNIFNIVSKYNLTDEVPLLGSTYYRLKAVDLDGSYEFFKIISVRLSGEKKVVVFPNPSSGQQIDFITNFINGEQDRIVLIDQLGIELANIPARNAKNSLKFGRTLQSGVYLLRYVSEDFETVERVFVQNK